VATQRFSPSDVVARLKKVAWFSRCGEPGEFRLSVPCETVKSWSQVNKVLKSRSRENAWLDAQNQLTSFLSEHHRERYQKWNGLIDKINVTLKSLRKKDWEPVQKTHDLDMKFIYSLEWSICGAFMENEYLDCGHKVFFFLELLTLYEAGHLPCGWNGDWPQGSLLVY
jgi:hypothetical protein